MIANWKMNPVKGSDAEKLFLKINKASESLTTVQVVVCPPLIYLQSLGQLITKRSCVLGAQDAFWEHSGPYTGQVSPDMVFNTKSRYVIVGHSERKAMGETDDMINKKIKSILQFPLIPIVCVGEVTRTDTSYVKEIKGQVHQALHGLTHEQIKRIIIAYEPVWAIGAQAVRHCSPAECRESVQVIRQVLADILQDTQHASEVPVVYGGSVDATNVASFIQDGLVQGVLVGRASLDPKVFGDMLKIVEKLDL